MKTVSFWLHGSDESNVEIMEKAGFDEITIENCANLAYEIEVIVAVNEDTKTGRIVGFKDGKTLYREPMRG